MASTDLSGAIVKQIYFVPTAQKSSSFSDATDIWPLTGPEIQIDFLSDPEGVGYPMKTFSNPLASDFLTARIWCSKYVAR